MPPEPAVTHETDAARKDFADRWSKNLVGGGACETTSGFNLGVASYHASEFGEPQTHDDQEAVYVVSGVGELMLGDQVVPVSPGTAAYIPPGTPHATRRTGGEPVKVVYAHGAI